MLQMTTETNYLTSDSPGVDCTFGGYGGLFREEAIMLLRRFYIQENEKGERKRKRSFRSGLTIYLAPEPKPKRGRELNTEVTPISLEKQGLS